MYKNDILSGLFLLALSIAICAGSLQFQVGTLTAPGSGFFPFVTGLLLGVFSILILIQARKAGREPVRFWAPGADKKSIYLTVIFVLFYALFLERLGFIVTTILFFILSSRFVSGHRWSRSVFFGLVTSLATYFAFTILLHAPLPDGVMGRIF